MSESLKKGSKASMFQQTAVAPALSRAIFGAQHPPRHVKPQPQKKDKVRSRDAFQDFQEKTSDAWDDGDDDVLVMSSHNHVRGSVSLMSRSGQPDANISTNRALTVLAKSRLNSFTTGDNTYTSSSAPNTPSHHRINRGPSGHTNLPPGHHHRPPVRINQNPSVSPLQPPASAAALAERDKSKRERFFSLLQAPNIDLDELRKVSWSGIVSKYRPVAWKLLSGYLPPIVERHASALERKRSEYLNYVEQYYSTRHQEIHQETYRQIQTDVPRMSPLIPLFQQELVQEMFERILYIWSIRHPASGYVQGINDLVTPFFIVFLSEYVDSDVNVESVELSSIPADSRQCLEADSYWCFSRLLDGIQDNYTFAQPGIQTRINSLKELVSRIDNGLHRHLEHHKVEYLQFSFRWMNNLLMRELPMRCVIRLWDTYLSEPDGFASFHLYVCAAFLTRFSQELQYERDFHGLMLMLQNLPTHHWTDVEIGLVLAEAYRLKYTFADAPKHFRNDSTAVVSNATSS